MTQPTSAAKNFYQIVKSAPKGRYKGIKRNYEVEDVLKLRGSIDIEYTLATRGANKLWQLLHTEPYVAALGAQTGNQAVQMIRAGLKAIYLSGWQVAADANSVGDMYPDQSLYPSNSGPELAKRINKALRRADQVECVEADDYKAQRDWYAPIVADAEAGFGGSLNCFELMKAYIEAGASGVHFEDQLGSEKKCGHMGGKVLIPIEEHIRHLNAARLAADVCGVPTIIVARTDAESARLLTSDVDERDHPFIDRAQGRSPEGFYRLKDATAVQACIERAKAYAPYCDLIWMETSHPTLSDAKEFAEGVRKEYPDKMFAYNCSPSFNWKKHLRESDMAKFQRELGAMGFKYQFITLAGFHANNFSIFDLARKYRENGMLAYSELQEKEFASETHGYTAVKHQREVGTGYFDYVSTACSGGVSSTTALKGSTEEAQFHTATAPPDEDEILTITLPEQSGDEKVLTPDSLRFLRELHTNFESRRLQLLAKRKQLQSELDQARYFPDYDPNTANIRNDLKWRGSEIPADLKDRRVEITGPPERKMVINALNSGAKVFMADFEDSTSPTWRNMVDGQKNLYDAVRNEIQYVHPATKQQYKLDEKHAVLKVRPRGWHLPEKHVLVNDKPMSGSLFDFGLFAFHNARALLDKGSGPYFYLPKLQSAEEAQLWADVFKFAEEKLGVPRGSIKCTVLIEHLLASFQMDEIIHALKDHIVGLNCGRWDYIFSYIKVFRNHRRFIIPDRFQVGMTSPFLRAYSLATIKTCHQRHIAAMGGMAAQIPIKHDPVANEKALAAVRADKEREVTDGHDGTWVAHPGLVPLAKEVFDRGMSGPNQISKQLGNYQPSKEELTAIPEGTITEFGFRRNISVTLGYMDSWLRGVGCVPLYNLMEDAATAEISRAQLWQWLRHEARIDQGETITPNMVKQTIAAETERRMIRAGSVVNRLPEAAELLEKFVLEDELSDFLTLEDDEVVNHADLGDLFLDILQPEDHENAEDFVVEHDQDIGDDGQQESIATAVSADDSEDSEVMSYSPVAHRTRSRSRVRAVQMGAQGDQNAAPVILNVDNDEGAVEVPAAKGPTRQRQARAPRPKSKAVAHTNDAAQPSTSGVQVQRGRSRTNQNKKRNAAQHDVRAKSKGKEQAVVTLGAPRTPVWRKETNAPTENAGPTATKQATTSAAHQSSGKSKEVVTRRKKIASHAVVAVSNAISAQAAHKPKETAAAAPKNAGVGPRTPRSAVQTRAKQQKVAAVPKQTNKVDSHQPGTSKMKPQKNAGAPNAAAAPSQPEGILTRAQKAKLEKAQAAQN
ncbi:hypothetical protein AAVH_02403 [Aphelenchoides avenae]|nr:hypothetical protein AAVH_02403 [Aphelenchus avenae]